MILYQKRASNIIHTVKPFLIVVVCFLIVFYKVESKRSSSHRSPSAGYVSRNIPLFRPLRRMIRNVDPSRTTRVTLVFQTSVKPRVRWFRWAGPNTLPNAEITDMINIDGDIKYIIRTISSYDITAVTLTIKPLDKLPIKLITCFSIDEVPFQYQLETRIDEVMSNETTMLDGLIWISAPPPTVTFSQNGQLTVSCTVRFDSESLRSTDELIIYRSYLDRKRPNKGGVAQLMSAGCAKIHRDREDYAEESGKYISAGRRVMVPGAKSGPVTYEVSFKVLNGSQDDVGVYTCAAEREKDRTYISSWVRLTQPSAPVMIFVACAENVPDTTPLPDSRKQYDVILTGLKDPDALNPTCVRCRAYDYRSSVIELTKNGVSVQKSTQFMRLDWHLNVADGGLSELTITFLKPTKDVDHGQYICSITNESGSDSVTFNIAVRIK